MKLKKTWSIRWTEGRKKKDINIYSLQEHVLEDIKLKATWTSLLQSTESLTMKTAPTLSEKIFFFSAKSTIGFSWLAPFVVVHFLYGARGSMLSKKDAYSSIERTFLKITKMYKAHITWNSSSRWYNIYKTT